MILRDRFPKFNQIIPVFAVVSMFVYGWTTYRVLQKLPSWLYYLNVREILFNLSHTLVINFIESFLVLCMLVILSAVLPKNLFGDIFIARGTLLAILGLGYLIYLALVIGQSKASQFPMEMFNLVPIVGLVILGLSVFLPLVSIARSILEGFADRAVVFLYILVPLSAVAGVIFVVSNLF